MAYECVSRDLELAQMQANVNVAFAKTVKRMNEMGEGMTAPMKMKLRTQMEAMISGAKQTLRHNGMWRWLSPKFMWGLLADKRAQQHFAVWLSRDVFELDGAADLVMPASRDPVLTEIMKRWNTELASGMKALWSHWRADISDERAERMMSELLRMAGGEYIRVSADESAWQWLFRALWFSIMQHTQNLENIFNKWDVCTLGKCKMDVRRMVCRVAYAANELPELEALIKSEHKPVVGRTKAAKATKRNAAQMLAEVVPNTQKKKKVRVRVVHTNASVHCAVKWQLQRNSNLYSNVRLTTKKEGKLPSRIGLPFKAQHAADVARTQGKKVVHDATDWGELATKLGPLPMAGGSITTVNLNQVPVEDIRKLLASHFQPNGCQSVKELKEWATAEKKTAKDTRALLENLMRALFEAGSQDAETSAVEVNEDMIRYIQIRDELRQIIVKKEK